MSVTTVNTVLIQFVLRNELMRGITQLFSLMEQFPKHRMEIAKERIRAKLSFENLIKIPEYRNLTKEKYESLINKIETIALIILEIYINKSKI